jgi:molybdopterin converting factor small subunit
MPAEQDRAGAPDHGSVTVRYWAAARAAAGVECDVVTGCATVGAAIAAATALRPALTPVAAVSSLLLDGRAASRDDDLADGAVVEVLPPFAGG